MPDENEAQDVPVDKLTPEQARLLIKTIEEVEKEEAED